MRGGKDVHGEDEAPLSADPGLGASSSRE
jgi:hypothetical protein